MKTLIIAEAGVNHNGDLVLARRLIDVAAESGADLVKFQTFSADRLATTHAGKAEYQRSTTDAAESQHAMLRRLELNREMHEALIAPPVISHPSPVATATAPCEPTCARLPRHKGACRVTLRKRAA